MNVSGYGRGLIIYASIFNIITVKTYLIVIDNFYRFRAVGANFLHHFPTRKSWRMDFVKIKCCGVISNQTPLNLIIVVKERHVE